MRRSKKKNIIIYILLLFMFLGIGYALLNTTLWIDGTTNFRANTWNVYIDDQSVNVINGSVQGTPTVTNGEQISVQCNLDEPEDYIAFTFDIVNDGSIDAMVGSVALDFTTTSDDRIWNFLDIQGRYISGAEFETGQILRAHTRETIQMYFKYRPGNNLDSNYLPTENQTVTIHAIPRYIQADSTANEINATVYRFSEDVLKVGDTMPFIFKERLNSEFNTVEQFNNTAYAIKHEVNGSEILSQSLVFKLTGSTLYELSPNDYENSVSTMQTAFGAANCELQSNDGDPLYLCENSLSDVTAVATESGTIGVGKTSASKGCIIFQEDIFQSHCFE